MRYDKEKVEELRQKYPPGTRIRLIEMNDPWVKEKPYSNVFKAGILGTVQMVDDAGTIHMHWDIGSSLGLIPDEDKFEIAKNG